MPPPRLAPGIALPPYAYVSGHFPHPVRDPRGHRHGESDEVYGPPPGNAEPGGASVYLHVLDLFNCGYYWEAHEALEKWWKEVDGDDPRHPFFHGLLRLSAAGVKAREGRPAGVRTHAARAAELLRMAALRLGGDDPCLLGLRLRPLAEAADALALRAASFRAARPMPAVDAVLGIRLLPA